jgi:hypothetical protein
MLPVVSERIAENMGGTNTSTEASVRSSLEVSYQWIRDALCPYGRNARGWAWLGEG